jgi:Trk K+ transport system NAD-binding subunit
MHTTRRRNADRTDSTAEHVLVIGGNRFGLAVAEYLTESARSVTYAAENRPPTEIDGVEALQREIADATDVRALASEVRNVDLVVVVGSDSKALLTGHLVRREFDPCVVVAGLSDPSNQSAFEGTEVEPIDMARLLADAVRDRNG